MMDNNANTYGSPSTGAYGIAQPGSPSPSESESSLEDGSRKRKRPMNVTCEACKARKVKCDRQQPACGWCAKNDHICEYRERKKPGLRAGYGRELETKILQLEELVYEQGRQLAAHLSSCGESANGSASTTSPFARSHAGRSSHEIHAGVVPNAPQQNIDPNLRPSSSRQGSLQYAASQQAVMGQSQAPARYPPSNISHDLMSPQSVGTVYHQATGGSFEPGTALPPYDLLYSLVDLYFKQINIWLPLFDRKVTFDKLFGSASLEEADRILLHALVATSLRFSKDARLTDDARKHYHDSCKQKVQLFGLENSNVRSLQALVILALDVTGTTNGPPGWNLIALISRNVVQLGLSVEVTSLMAAPLYPSIATLRASVLPNPKSWVEDEERRRLFWAVYLLDRYATLATAFEFALNEKEVDRRLPCREDLFAANQPVETRYFQAANSTSYSTTNVDSHGHFSYHCELMGILGQIHQFLKRPIDIESHSDVEQWQASYRALDGQLNTWHFGLPDDFANITRLMKANMPAKAVSCGWIMLHAAHSLTVIRLNSSAAYPSQTSQIFSSSYSAMQRCLGAVESVRQLAQFVLSSGLLDKLGPPFAFAIWVCARVTLVHGSTMDHEVDPDIGFFITVLSQMGLFWDVARRYSEILSRVLNEYQQSRGSLNFSGERVTPSAVRILADMRRCAYDLDFLISRQPQNSIKSYQPTRQNTPGPNEMEYLDVFDLFNFPRLPAGPMNVENSNNEHSVNHLLAPEANGSAGMIPSFAVPNPEADWLFNSR